MKMTSSQRNSGWPVVSEEITKNPKEVFCGLLRDISRDRHRYFWHLNPTNDDEEEGLHRFLGIDVCKLTSILHHCGFKSNSNGKSSSTQPVFYPDELAELIHGNTKSSSFYSRHELVDGKICK